jgi:tellurite resistance protein
MERLAPTADEALAGLRMCATVARADGELSPKETALLSAAGRALGAPCDPATLPPIDAGDVAMALRDPVMRERAVQAALLVAMIDGEVDAAEVRTIESFAGALGVSEPRIANLRQLAEGHVRRMWLDLARRSFAKPIFEEALRARGLGGVWNIVGPMMGLAQRPDLVRRYNDLGRLPDGTLGRQYWRFVVDNDLGFPGEGIVAEAGVWHDLTHVLGGYGVEPEGEVQVVSFIAGYRREDPFFWLFTIALQFHLGVRVSPYSPPGRGYFEPDAVIGALRRGMAMNKDLSVGWDYWDDLRLPVADVRTKYGVPPR